MSDPVSEEVTHHLTIHSDEEGMTDINPITHEVIVSDLPDGNVRYYFKRREQESSDDQR